MAPDGGRARRKPARAAGAVGVRRGHGVARAAATLGACASGGEDCEGGSPKMPRFGQGPPSAAQLRVAPPAHSWPVAGRQGAMHVAQRYLAHLDRLVEGGGGGRGRCTGRGHWGLGQTSIAAGSAASALLASRGWAWAPGTWRRGTWRTSTGRSRSCRCGRGHRQIGQRPQHGAAQRGARRAPWRGVHGAGEGASVSRRVTWAQVGGCGRGAGGLSRRGLARGRPWPHGAQLWANAAVPQALPRAQLRG